MPKIAFTRTERSWFRLHRRKGDPFIRIPDETGTAWYIASEEFSAQATAFAIRPPLPGEYDHKTGTHTLYLVSCAGPREAVRAVTASVVGKMASNAGRLYAVDETHRRVASYDVKRPSLHPYRGKDGPEPPKWARPTPVHIADYLYEGAAYSRLAEAKYLAANDPGHTFLVTSDEDDELPAAFHRWARARLPAPMMPEWAEAIYEAGVSAGAITPLISYGLSAALCEWSPELLRETIRILGLTGRISAPKAADARHDLEEAEEPAPAMPAAAD